MPENIVSLNRKVKMGLIKQALGKKETIALVMQGKSMEPFLREGDYLFISKCRLQDYEFADIIAFETNATNMGLIVHRILNKRGDYFFTKGDASLRRDPPVAFSKVLGKLITVNRNDKTLGVEKSKNYIMLLGSYLRVFWFYRQLNLFGRLRR